MITTLVKKLLGRNDPDPYWDAFLNRPLADPKNLVLDVITHSPGGGVFTPKMDIHDPAAVSGHIAELTRFFGADLAGVTATDPTLVELIKGPGGEDDLPAAQLAERYPYTIVGVAHWEHDAKEHPGMGGQLGRQKMVAANFHLRSYLRELGYEAVFGRPLSPAVAVAAGLGSLDKAGRLVTRKYGARVALETVVLTNLPMIPHPSSVIRSSSVILSEAKNLEGGRGR